MVLFDRNLKGRDPPGLKFAQARAVAPVDDPAWQVPEQIDDLFPDQAFDMFAHTRTDALERGDGRKDGEQDLWAGAGWHDGDISCAGAADISDSYRYILRQRQRPSQ